MCEQLGPSWASSVRVCHCCQECAFPSHNSSHRLVEPSCWPPPAHLHWRNHFHWWCLWAWALSTVLEKASPFNHSWKAASPHGFLHPGRTSTWRGEMMVGSRSSRRPEHLRFLQSYLKFSSSPSVNASWIVVCLWSISGAQKVYYVNFVQLYSRFLGEWVF